MNDDERLLKGVAAFREIMKNDDEAVMFVKDQNTILYLLALLTVAVDTDYVRKQDEILAHALDLIETHLSQPMSNSLLKSVTMVQQQFSVQEQSSEVH